MVKNNLKIGIIIFIVVSLVITLLFNLNLFKREVIIPINNTNISTNGTGGETGGGTGGETGGGTGGGTGGNVIPAESNILSSDFRNFYGISWVGTACDNLAYAKSMGYDYVVYQSGMKNCPYTDKKDMRFYISDPEAKASSDHYTWELTTNKTYTQIQIDKYNSFFAWKGNGTVNTVFPYNLATGWWFSKTSFRPNADYQQQVVIDWTVNDALQKIKEYEDLSSNFTFGGYSWDVPDLKGDWWTGRQNTSGHIDCLTGVPCTGKIVSLSYWNNGIESSGLHTGITHEYSTYTEGRTAMFKKLFSETKKQYPDMKIYYQPYHLYDYISVLQQRSDKLELMPKDSVYYCQESASSQSDDIQFLTDTRIYSSGLITKNYVCNDNPDNQDVDRSLILMGNTAINGAWLGFFGRFGGTHGAIAYQSITVVPNRLKLIRIVPTWDNMYQIPLNERHWDSVNKIYNSSNSYADMELIYSRHPKNKNIYAVFVTGNIKTINLKVGEQVDNIYAVDGLFKKTTSVLSNFIVSDGKIIPNSNLVADTGIIIELK